MLFYLNFFKAYQQIIAYQNITGLYLRIACDIVLKLGPDDLWNIENRIASTSMTLTLTYFQRHYHYLTTSHI